MTIPYRITPQSITIVLNGVTHILTVDSHPNYTKVREAIKAGDFTNLDSLINVSLAVEQFGKGKVKVVNGVVQYGGYAVHNTLTKRMLEQMGEGFDINPMAAFLENLMQNPSKRAVDELYDFLEACDLPITDDGNFVAYKKVSAGYFDLYTNTVLNKPANLLTGDEVAKLPYTTEKGVTVTLENGVVVASMPRNRVDEEKSRTCSQGLHFCSQSYLPHYGCGGGSKVLIVKINPRDVVAIPTDYQNAKGRTCRYEVIGEVETSKLKFWSSPVYQTNEDEEDVWVEVDADNPVTEPVNQVTEPVNPIGTIDATLPMVARAAKYGYVKNGLVPVTYDDEMTVHTHDNMPAGAVMRSYETKTVRKAVKEAVERLEANLAVAAAPQFQKGAHPMGAYVSYSSYADGTEFVVDQNDLLETAIENAHADLIDDYYSYIVIRDQSGNEMWRGEADHEFSSSEGDLDSSSEDESSDDEVALPPTTVVSTTSNREGILFTKAQAAAILGKSLHQLDAILLAGDGVELVGERVRFKN